jgi:hypothetical protein
MTTKTMSVLFKKVLLVKYSNQHNSQNRHLNYGLKPFSQFLYDARFGSVNLPIPLKYGLKKGVLTDMLDLLNV